MKPFRVTITFGKSSSKRYDKAVSIAQSFEEYQYVGSRHILDVRFGPHETAVWQDLWKLFNMTEMWKSATATCETPRQTTPLELLGQLWDVYHCKRQRDASGLGDSYCFGKMEPDESKTCFGCRFLKGVTHSNMWRPHTVNWIQFGTLSSDCKTFTVGKTEILEFIKFHNEGQIYTYCEHFSKQRVIDAVSSMPAVIDIENSYIFEVKYGDDGSLDHLKPIGIRLKDFGPSINISELYDRFLKKNTPEDDDGD